MKKTNTLDRALSIAGGTVVALFTLVMYFLATTTVTQGATTQDDIRLAIRYGDSSGIYSLVESATPLLHTNDCRGSFFPKKRAILVSCGRGTTKDRALAVYLHELGHSEQLLSHTRLNPKQVYEQEVDAWKRGEALAKTLGIWGRLDKLEWEIIKEIGLHSYRQKFAPTWNFIQ